MKTRWRTAWGSRCWTAKNWIRTIWTWNSL